MRKLEVVNAEWSLKIVLRCPRCESYLSPIYLPENIGGTPKALVRSCSNFDCPDKMWASRSKFRVKLKKLEGQRPDGLNYSVDWEALDGWKDD